MKGFLLDTNVPSELTNPRPSTRVEQWLEDVDNKQLFSVISLAEICKGIAKLSESRKRTNLQEWLDSTLRPWFAGRILPVTEPIRCDRPGARSHARNAQRERFCRVRRPDL